MPGEAEEESDAAVVVDVGRAVHREDALERKPIVHKREDRLLDLAGVVRAADYHLRAPRVQDDERPAVRAVLVRIRLDGGRVQDERLRIVLSSSSAGGSMKSVLAKSACHGLSVITRSERRCAGSAPANAFTT